MSHAETKHALEAALKAATLQLSRILAYQARLQHHATVQYAPPAPTMLVKQLARDARAFDDLCRTLEQRVLRAIAVLERDLRRANGTALPAAEAQADPPDDDNEDLAMPFALPSTTASDSNMQIDLTGEQSSPPPPPPPPPAVDDGTPAASTATAAIPAAAAATTTTTTTTMANTGDGLLSEMDLSMPFQLPSSTAALAAPAPSAPQQPPPPASSSSAVAAAPTAFPDSTADDIDALLSSLNMPAFSAPPASASASSSTSMSSAVAAPSSAAAFDYTSLLLDPSAATTTTDILAPGPTNGLGLGLDVAPPAAGTVVPGRGAAEGTTTSSAAPPPPPAAAAAAAAAPTGTTTQPQPQQPAATVSDEFDFASFDFAALGLAAPASGSGPGLAPPPPVAAAVQDLDFSILTGSSSAAAPTSSTARQPPPAAAAGHETGAPSEMMDIDELLKSLGGV